MYTYMPFIVDDKQAWIDMCHSFVEQQYSHQIYYTETRFAPHILCERVLTAEEVLVIVLDALEEASKKYGIIVKTILCCLRHWKADERAQETVNLAIKYRHKGVVAVDLAGSEQAASSKEYKKIFDQVKGVEGLHITIHAGEGCGPESVNDALQNLHAERIGHGYRSLEDEDVLNHLVDKQIHLECCPSSSIITRAVRQIVLHDEDWSNHPMATFVKKKVNFSISTDDPCVMAINYSHEIDVCSNLIKMDEKAILQCHLNGAKAAFINGKEKSDLVETIETRINKKLREIANKASEDKTS